MSISRATILTKSIKYTRLILTRLNIVESVAESSAKPLIGRTTLITTFIKNDVVKLCASCEPNKKLRPVPPKPVVNW